MVNVAVRLENPFTITPWPPARTASSFRRVARPPTCHRRLGPICASTSRPPVREGSREEPRRDEGVACTCLLQAVPPSSTYQSRRWWCRRPADDFERLRVVPSRRGSSCRRRPMLPAPAYATDSPGRCLTHEVDRGTSREGGCRCAVDPLRGLRCRRAPAWCRFCRLVRPFCIVFYVSGRTASRLARRPPTWSESLVTQDREPSM